MGSCTGPRAPAYVAVRTSNRFRTSRARRTCRVTSKRKPVDARTRGWHVDTAGDIRDHPAHGVHAGPQHRWPGVDQYVADEVARRPTRQRRMDALPDSRGASRFVLRGEPRVRRAQFDRPSKGTHVGFDPRDARLPDVRRLRTSVGPGRHERDEVLRPGREPGDLEGDACGAESTGGSHARVHRPCGLGA